MRVRVERWRVQRAAQLCRYEEAHRHGAAAAPQVCTERLREWFASEVFKPLVRAVDGAHLEVVSCAARLGWAGLQLSPLHEALAGRPAGEWEWEGEAGM